MKRFLILIFSLFIAVPCFAFNCGDDFGRDDGSAQYVRNEYKEFVECNAYKQISKLKFGEDVYENLRVAKLVLSGRKQSFSVQEYNGRMDYILELSIMNLLGSIPNNLEENYSIMLSMDGMDMDEIEEEFSELLEETRIVKDKQRYKLFIAEAVTYLMNNYNSEYRVVDLTANYLKIMNTSNKSGMKGQLTDLYNKVILYNKGKSKAKYK